MGDFDFIVFGGTGLQGRICARDLIESGYKVLIVGRDSSSIKSLLRNKKAKFIEADLRDERKIVQIIKESRAKIVVNCAELSFNVPIMKACIELKKNLTDLGGLHDVTKEQFKLHEKFKKKDILCITGCGSTPGIASVMAAYGVAGMDKVDTIYLGFAWDSNIKQFVVPYSIQSIFEEFTKPPITYHAGKFVKEYRFSCKGVWDFKEVGRQTVYCIVHSEVYTFPRYFTKKGIKHIHYFAGFPEHSMSVIKNLLDLGFGSEKCIQIGKECISPVNFTTKVLKKMTLPADYKEVEDLWVRVEGIKHGEKHVHEMDCVIKTTKGWESAGSNVDTGRTCSIISQMLLRGEIKDKGVHAPEGVVPHIPFFRELGKRGMYIYEHGRKIN